MKKWTLPVAIGLGAAVYLLFANIKCFDSFSLQAEPFFNELLPWLMFTVLLVTFCKVDFRSIRLTMWHFWIMLSQVVIVALLTVWILRSDAASEHKVLLESVLTCVICPTAAAATVVTVKLGGDLMQMTAYTLISNLSAAVFIPLVFPVIEPQSGIAFLPSFLMILRRVAIVLVAPLFFGWLIKHHLPRLQRKIVSVNDLGFYLWGVSLMIVSGTTIKNIAHSDASIPLLCIIATMSLVICLLQFALGKAIGRPYKRSIDAGQALGQKNTAFSIWVTSLYLNPIATLGPGCYILWQNIINSWEIVEKESRKQP